MTSIERRSLIALTAMLGWTLGACAPPVVAPGAADTGAPAMDGAQAIDSVASGGDIPIDVPEPIDHPEPMDSRRDAGRDVPGVPSEDGALDASRVDVPRVDVSVARLIFPLANHAVTTHRPDLRWALAAGDGATVEICRDRACASVVTTFDVVGTHARPPAALDPGVYFWRIYERTGGVRATTPSATWYFHVDARDTAVDTAWDSGLDVNGDGYHDFYLWGRDAAGGWTHLYLGGRSGPTRATEDRVSSYIRVEDVNGDGFQDFLHDNPSFDPIVRAGGPTGLTTRSLGMIPSPDTVRWAGPLGDTNDDGYADVLVGRALVGQIHLGGAAGISVVPIFEYSVSHFPKRAAIGHLAFDLNGDRRGDLVAGETVTVIRHEYVLLSSERGHVAAGVLCQFPEYYPAGDMNGDGFADLSVGCGFPVMHGAFVAGGPGTELGELGFPLPNFQPIDLIGDVNGDGCGDVQMMSAALSIGRTVVAIGYGIAGSEIAFTEGSAGHRGQPGFRPVNDVNGDGCDDVLQIVDNEARLFLGNPAGLSTTPSMVLPNVR